MVNIMIKVFELSVRIVRLTLIAFIIMQLVNIAIAGSDPQVGTKEGYRLVVKKGKTPVSPSPVVIHEKTVFSFNIALYDENNNRIENLPPNMTATYTIKVPQYPKFIIHMFSGLYKEINNTTRDNQDYWRKTFGRVTVLDFSTQITGAFPYRGFYDVTLEVEVKKEQSSGNVTWRASETIALTVVDAYFQPGTVGPASNKQGEIRFSLSGFREDSKATKIGHAFFLIEVRPPEILRENILQSLIRNNSRELLGKTIGWSADQEYKVIIKKILSPNLRKLTENIINIDEPGILNFDPDYASPNGKYSKNATVRRKVFSSYSNLQNAIKYADDMWQNKNVPQDNNNRIRYKLVTYNCSDVCIEQGKAGGIDIAVDKARVKCHATKFNKYIIIEEITLPGDIGRKITTDRTFREVPNN